VVTLFTWRAIFLALFAYAVAMLALCVRSLPETLPPHARRPFGIGILMNDYVAVFCNRRFRLVALAIALNFAGLFGELMGGVSNVASASIRRPAMKSISR
jgi:DHA1 family bicyclomycin/chloramphenicol resistance-like MFS transporter